MIRAAQPGDADAIAAIWNTVIRDTAITFTTTEKSREDILGLIAAQPFFVALEDDDIVGFASFGPFRAGPGYRRVAEHTVYVTPRAQRQGQGARLLAQIETCARTAGICALIAGIGGENPGAVSFHARSGFHEVGRLPGIGEKFGRRHDLILMQKDLCA